MVHILEYVHTLNHQITRVFNKFSERQILAGKLKTSIHHSPKLHKTLSKGEIAAIVIAVVMVFLIAFLCKYLQKRRAKKAAMSDKESN